MPVVVVGERHRSPKKNDTSGACLNVALVNNMPDAALEDTEAQFSELLDCAAGDVQVNLQLYSLPGIPRGRRGQQRLKDSYLPTEDIFNHRFDGVIITGTEPRQPDLRNETYWPDLTNLLDWAEQNTTSTILSCLAAHAGVLHSDGIERHPLADKQFGVFEYRVVTEHESTRGALNPICFPHSRWNEVREDELIANEYVILTASTKAGVNSFLKQKGNSLFVHFQGHPEYGAETLLKEYERDIRRFLKHEREMYPKMPIGYFDAATTQALSQFQEKALADRCEDLLASFPRDISGRLFRTWQRSATCLYHNWLQYLVARSSLSSAQGLARSSGRKNKC